MSLQVWPRDNKNSEKMYRDELFDDLEQNVRNTGSVSDPSFLITSGRADIAFKTVSLD